MDRDQMQGKLFAWLRPTFQLTYSNPHNAIIVPYGTTRVVLDSEPLGDGRFSVQIRASILMDLELSDDLLLYVALNCNSFRLGSLYLFKVDDTVDLDYVNKVISTWLGAEEVAELVAVAGNNAVAASRDLQGRYGGRLANPSGHMQQTVFIGEESTGRQDVWNVLNDALETQRSLVVGTAERIELSGIGALTEGWVVVNTQFIWLAGRDQHTAATTLWRIPHTDVGDDHVTTTGAAPTYTARLANGTVLFVATATVEAAAALREAHHDPRDLNDR